MDPMRQLAKPYVFESVCSVIVCPSLPSMLPGEKCRAPP